MQHDNSSSDILQSKKALGVDDDKDMSRLLGSILESDGYQVEFTSDGEEAGTAASQSKPYVVVLDLTLPSFNGLEVCSELRRRFRGLILALSGSGEEATIAKSLYQGAEYYINKPFRAHARLARRRELIRQMNATEIEADSLSVGDLTIDFARRRTQRNGEEIKLPRTEFDIGSFLVRNLERVVTANKVLQRVWDPCHGEYAQKLRVHIGHIRKKIQENPSAPRFLLTESGVGYRFSTPARAAAATLS